MTTSITGPFLERIGLGDWAATMKSQIHTRHATEKAERIAARQARGGLRFEPDSLSGTQVSTNASQIVDISEAHRAQEQGERGAFERVRRLSLESSDDEYALLRDAQERERRAGFGPKPPESETHLRDERDSHVDELTLQASEKSPTSGESHAVHSPRPTEQRRGRYSLPGSSLPTAS